MNDFLHFSYRVVCNMYKSIFPIGWYVICIKQDATKRRRPPSSKDMRITKFGLVRKIPFT